MSDKEIKEYLEDLGYGARETNDVLALVAQTRKHYAAFVRDGITAEMFAVLLAQYDLKPKSGRPPKEGNNG